MLLKEKLMSGNKIAGVMLRVARNPAVCHIAKNAGLDFVMFDCEHGDYSWETLHDMFLLAAAVGLGAFVRVPEGTKDNIARALDCGASGVMVPMVETAAYAETLVQYAKYQPVGGRGYASSFAHTEYKATVPGETMERQNSRVLAIAQIESKCAVENIDEIAAVPGLDACLIGPSDLSLSLGVPGDILNPIQLAAIAKVAEACRKNGKAFGLHAPESLLGRFAKELTLVMSLTDVDLYMKGFSDVRRVVDELAR